MVSFIIPVAHDRNIIKCINSIINSIVFANAHNCEIIIVFNGSTKSFIEFIESKISENFIKELYVSYYVTNIRNIAYARNIGIKHATKEYISFIDSDCLVEETYIKHLLRIIDEESPDLLKGKVKFLYNHWFALYASLRTEWYLKYGFILLPNLVGKRELFLKNKFNENFSHNESVKWAFDMGLKGKSQLKVIDDLVIYHLPETPADFIRSIYKYSNVVYLKKIREDLYGKFRSCVDLSKIYTSTNLLLNMQLSPFRFLFFLIIFYKSLNVNK